ncbi:MAG: sigma-70 family RNA polymerase sigma factor [Pirellulales bacterium]|nr:sigma-70 family RNA polymerase sigma factor [Pirellulales bacterium]
MEVLETNLNTQFASPELAQVAELVIAARDGDRYAFGQLVERYQGSIYALAMRRLGDACDAEELTQEVFVHALEKLHQLKEPACFGSWLRQIARRMAINRMVRRKPVVATEPSTLDATVEDVRTPDAEALANERKAAVRAAVRRLRPLDRKTLNAFYVEGQSLIEMADQFGAPIGTIKRRLHVARKRLAQELESSSAV